MLFLPSVTQRNRQPEVMDQPDLEVDRHFRALRGLERINWLSGSARILWPPLAELARRKGVESLRLLDMATGAGDVPIRLWHMAQRAGLNFKISACDCSGQALDYARQSADRKQAAIHFFEWDLSRNSLPDDYDVVMCSLFLHHQGEDQAVQMLKSMRKTAQHLVLVNDLVRSIPGYFLAWFGSRVVTASDVVHVDGPRSVAAAFTVQEVQALAARAGLEGATVAKRWPCRFLLIWERL